MEKEKTEIREERFGEKEALLQAMADPASFRPIYERYFKQIFLFVNHRVGERQASADITQQVFLKALTGLGKYHFRGLPFSAWLFRIAINECNDYFRRTKRIRYVVIEDHQVEALHEELMSENTSEDLHARLPDVLQKLSPHELHFIELRYFEGRPFKEIAQIFGITETHAKVRVYRVLDKLKKLFLKYGA